MKVTDQADMMKVLLTGKSDRLPAEYHNPDAAYEYPVLYKYDEAHQQVLQSKIK